MNEKYKSTSGVYGMSSENAHKVEDELASESISNNEDIWLRFSNPFCYLIDDDRLRWMIRLEIERYHGKNEQ